ncbi:hypothetical protein QNH47_12685 [Virgibacillus halodenitrificans]|uniref:hypothetical protein n=1 Tax=Virgibacillus halodenitrificans TaxID=1482 RepID=UPI0024BFBA71|nr:hypothetical protein [Virgibacillus halodenitrificans]WHX25023.1 hypothetical protein QNH47_12685 [Virgibacillus halodenitrificans]
MKRLHNRRLIRKNVLSKRRINRRKNILANESAQKNELVWRKREIRFSLIAIIISMITFSWTLYQDYKNNQEEIIINSYTPTSDTNVSVNKIGLPKSPYIVTMRIGILLTNTNEKTVTLTNYRLEQIAKIDLATNFEYPTFYSGLDQGFSDENGTSQDLPFILKKGESKLVYINTGILINNNVFEKINGVYKKENEKDIPEKIELTYRELLYYLAKAQTDLYGNKTEGETYKIDEEEKLFHHVIDIDKSDFPIFSITFKSVNGTYFEHTFYEYKHENF